VTTVHVIRHAKAKNRLEWTEGDELRPLTKRGRREAAGLAERVRAEPPDRLVSSPSRRCIETLEPLASEFDLPIETTDLLEEGADGARALDLLLSLSREAASLACCTHGDVLYDLVREVASSGVPLTGPFDVPVASTWVLDVADGRVVRGTFVGRPSS
jgi:broad specificity phosphatase PhoE